MGKYVSGMARFSRAHRPNGGTNTAPFDLVKTKAVTPDSTTGFIGNQHPGEIVDTQRHITFDEEGHTVISLEVVRYRK